MTSLPVPVRSLTHLHASVIRSHLLRCSAVLERRDIGEAGTLTPAPPFPASWTRNPARRQRSPLQAN